jgi:hypothetical protein
MGEIYLFPGILLIITILAGIWLSRSGKPYNGVLFNVHKLIALGMVILTVIQLYKKLTVTGSTGVIWALMIFAGICVVVLFTTGALLSVGKLNYSVLKLVHSITPILLAIAMVLAIYLLGRGSVT